ncbi:MAG: small multi-drug export protein [Planctomycetaceae bacterium]|nr:small multi-drug export protein [Phycisphaerales bacterium]MCE2654404.1 small multi-drug export protein [Planctomycetaceae bacterium]
MPEPVAANPPPPPPPPSPAPSPPPTASPAAPSASAAAPQPAHAGPTPDAAPDLAAALAPQPPERLISEEVHYGENLKATNPTLWWGTLLGPAGFTLLALTAAWLVRGWEFMVNLAISAVMMFFGLGRAVLLLGRDGSTLPENLPTWQKFAAGMTTVELSILIIWMDTLVAFIMVFHASFIYRIPKVGPAMLAVQEDGQFILSRHPWFRRFAWLGLVAFVTFPFAATGSVGGSIVGRLLGISRWGTLSAVVAGSLISTLIVYLFASELQRHNVVNADNPWSLIGGIAVVVALAALVNWRYQVTKRRWAATGRTAPKA